MSVVMWPERRFTAHSSFCEVCCVYGDRFRTMVGRMVRNLRMKSEAGGKKVGPVDKMARPAHSTDMEGLVVFALVSMVGLLVDLRVRVYGAAAKSATKSGRSSGASPDPPKGGAGAC